MPPMEFEPTVSAGEGPQTYALDRAATGTGCSVGGRWRNELVLSFGGMILRGGKQNYPEKKHHKSDMEWPGFEVRSLQ